MIGFRSIVSWPSLREYGTTYRIKYYFDCAKSKNRRHECLESRVTNQVYQSCDSLCTCAEAVIFPPRVHVVYFILW